MKRRCRLSKPGQLLEPMRPCSEEKRRAKHASTCNANKTWAASPRAPLEKHAAPTQPLPQACGM